MKIKEALQETIEQFGDMEIVSVQTNANNITELINPFDSRFKNTGLKGENEIPIASELIIKIRYYEQTNQKEPIQNPG